MLLYVLINHSYVISVHNFLLFMNKLIASYSYRYLRHRYAHICVTISILTVVNKFLSYHNCRDFENMIRLTVSDD